MTVLAIDPRARYRVNLAALPTAPHLAREFLAQLLDLWGVCEADTDNAVLLVSELATNATVAAGRVIGPHVPSRLETIRTIAVRACISRIRLTVEVWDPSPEQPAPQRFDEDSEGGRGLFLVEAIAESWGFQHAAPRQWPAENGKVTWFTLALTQEPHPRSARPVHEPASNSTADTGPPVTPAVPRQRPEATSELPRRTSSRDREGRTASRGRSLVISGSTSTP